jgi:hypothetical protein
MGSIALMPRPKRALVSDRDHLRASTQVQDLFQFEHCIFAGRGRSALALALIAADLPVGAPVIIPANICPSVIAAILFADMRPITVPVRSDTGLPDEFDVLKVLMETQGRGALLIAHLYGIHCSQHELVKEARHRRWIVIESDTLASTAYIQGTRLQSDALILSFGSGKSIDAGSGGALLMHDAEYAHAAKRVVIDWPVLTDKDNSIEAHLMLHRRALRIRKQSSLYANSLPQEIAEVPRSCNIDWDRLAHALSTLRGKRTLAIESWDQWAHLLRNTPLTLMPKPDYPWRLIAVTRYVEHRDALLFELREAKIDAGANYPSVRIFFSDFLKNNNLDNEDDFGSRVINFWLSDANSDKSSAIVAACASVR